MSLKGVSLGTTPLGDLAVPIGTHELVFRHPQLGERRQTVTVKAQTVARIGIDLENEHTNYPVVRVAVLFVLYASPEARANPEMLASAKTLYESASYEAALSDSARSTMPNLPMSLTRIAPYASSGWAARARPNRCYNSSWCGSRCWY